MKAVAFLLVFFTAAGCGTVQTGALKKGQVYKDPQGRFSAVITDGRRLVPLRTDEGVVFQGQYLDRADLIYAVLVYPAPAAGTGSDEQLLRSAWQNLVAKAGARHYSFNEVNEQVSTFQGHPCLDIYYIAQASDGSWRPYYSRFVWAGGYVYNLYYSDGNFKLIAGGMQNFQSKEGFDRFLKENAEKFFDGVKFALY